MILKKNILFFCFLVVAVTTQAQSLGGDVLPSPKNIKLRSRVSLMPILSFYNPHPVYMANPKALAGYGASYKAEFKFKRGSTFKLIAGAEYLMEGFKFDSYYFPVGTTQYYDKNYNYTHTLRIHQLYFPFMFKQGFNDEDQKQNSLYICAGWAWRYLLGSSSKITNKATSEVEWRGLSALTAQHRFLMDNAGSCLLAGWGWEHRMSDMGSAVTFEVFYRYNLSRVQYVGNNNSNAILFKNNNLTVGVGYEF
jgi:hypothetical protein